MDKKNRLVLTLPTPIINFLDEEAEKYNFTKSQIVSVIISAHKMKVDGSRKVAKEVTEAIIKDEIK